jgi:hypothetical protein
MIDFKICLKNIYFSSGTTDRRRDEDYVKTKEDAMTLLELECNQTFLGMVQMQYQARMSYVCLVWSML